MSTTFKRLSIIALTLFLSGCFHNVRDGGPSFDENFSHPELPGTVDPYQFDWRVITSDNVDSIGKDDVFVAVPYEDSLVFRQFLEDMKRYMLEANSLICYYRTDLKEAFCDNQIIYINTNQQNTQEDKE